MVSKSKEPKYALVHADLNRVFIHKADYNRPRMTGLFGWPECMEGELKTIVEDVDDYDIIHINVCTATLPYPGMLKQRGFEGTIVANLDYDMDMLPGHGGIKNFINSLNEADYIFGVSHSQIAGLQHLVSKDIHKINHPCDTEHIKPLQTPVGSRDGIGVMLHGKYRQPGHTITTATDRFMGKEKVILFNTSGNLDPEAFDIGYLPMDFHPYLNILSRMKVGLDGHRDVAWGRFQLDCAALGIPCVGPRNVENQLSLFPNLTVETHSHFEDMNDKIQLLLDNPDFYQACADYAFEKVQREYSYQSCKEAMLKAVRWGQ